MEDPTKQIENEPKQIIALRLVKSLFESIHGNLGLLRFSLEKLNPIPPTNENSEEWEIICSFYKTFSSIRPTKYYAKVNLKEKTVSVNALDDETEKDTTKEYKFVQKDK